MRTRNSGLQETRRWREMDSNPRSPVRESKLFQTARFVPLNKRSRTAFTSRSRCCEYRSVYTLTHRAPGPRRSAGVEITRTSEPNGRNRNGQSARLDTNFRPQNYGAMGKTLLATTMDGRVFDFSMGSTFRAIRQSPTRTALVSEIRRDCKAELRGRAGDGDRPAAAGGRHPS